MTALTPEQASLIAAFLLPQIKEEIQLTRKVLAAVPEGKKDYSPDPKSMTAAVLAEHIVSADLWFLRGVADVSFGEQSASGAQTMADLIAFYDQETSAVLKRIESLSGEDLAKSVEFYIWNLPNVAYLQLMQKHSVHHRGQLSVYLRPMGAKVPGIYGGSADEAFSAAASEGN